MKASTYVSTLTVEQWASVRSFLKTQYAFNLIDIIDDEINATDQTTEVSVDLLCLANMNLISQALNA